MAIKCDINDIGTDGKPLENIYTLQCDATCFLGIYSIGLFYPNLKHSIEMNQ